MPFRFQARYGLFTYAQCGELDPFEVVALFSSLGAECIIGRENHADEGVHLHAFVDFGRKFRSSDPRFADVNDRHPNVVPSRGTPEKGYDYATKDGDVVAGGLERPSGGGVSIPGDAWNRLVYATTESEFWDLARELVPRALLTSFPSLAKYAAWHYRADKAEYVSPPRITFDLSRAPELNQWLRNFMSGDHVGKSPIRVRRTAPNPNATTILCVGLGKEYIPGTPLTLTPTANPNPHR